MGEPKYRRPDCGTDPAPSTVCSRLISDPVKADDLVQDTLVRALSRSHLVAARHGYQGMDVYDFA